MSDLVLETSPSQRGLGGRVRRLPFPPCFTLTKPGSARRFVARVKIPPPLAQAALAQVGASLFCETF